MIYTPNEKQNQDLVVPSDSDPLDAVRKKVARAIFLRFYNLPEDATADQCAMELMEAHFNHLADASIKATLEGLAEMVLPRNTASAAWAAMCDENNSGFLTEVCFRFICRALAKSEGSNG